MERFPDPRLNVFSELLEHSSRLISLSEQAQLESRKLSRHLADLNSDSDHLIEHSRRLRDDLRGMRFGRPDPD